MINISTTLLALSGNLTNQILSLLTNLQIQTNNNITINTREGIITELENTKPSYLLISTNLPGTAQIEDIVIKAKQISPLTKIILITNENESKELISYITSGADGIIHNDNVLDSFEFAVSAMSKGQLFVCTKNTLELKVILEQKELEATYEMGFLELLTDRELEVLHSLTQGVNYKQISKLLFISESTVKTHINNIFTKLNVNDRTQAVLYALNHGIQNIINKPDMIKNIISEKIQK